MVNDSISWRDIDPNVREIVRQMNAFPGIETVASCGGHSNPGPGQNPEGVWDVIFRVEHREAGWRSLEFIAWVAHDIRRGLGGIWLFADSAPPYLNEPGNTLRFALRGHVDPEKVAQLMAEWRIENYLPATEP